MNSIKIQAGNEIEPIRINLRPEVSREGEGVTATHPEASHPVSAPEGLKDVIKVSDRATVIRSLVEQVSQLPDVRTERVEQLRSRVQSGTYHPDAGVIADALLRGE